MRFIQIGLEEDASAKEAVDLDPNETSKAIEAVENKDSTEPAKVLQVANYKEEIAALRAKNKTADTGESTDDKSNNADDSGSTDTDIHGGTDSDADATVPKDGDTSNKTVSEDPPTGDVEQTPGTAELGKDAPGKSDAEVAQEDFLVQGHKMALEALDSMQEMSRYQDMIKRRSALGGISPQTARIIFNALESHSLRCGYTLDKTQVPSLESYGSYSGAAQSTRELSVAIEGFLSATWEAIKKFFKSIWKWIMDILGGTKNGTPDSTAHPQTKQTRDGSIKDLESKIDRLKTKLKDTEKLDEKSKEKLPKNIAKALFKNKDKGTLKEAYNNGEVLASVADSFSMLAKFFEKESTVFSAGIILGKTTGLRSMMASKDNLGSIELGKLELLSNSYQLLAEYPTEEITNGIRAHFVLSGPNKEFYQVTSSQATSLLGKQGLIFVSDKKEQNDISVPELDDNGIANLNLIVNEIRKCYASINNSQAVLKAWAKNIKSYSEADTPSMWLGLDSAVVADLKAQTMLIGALEVSMAASYMKLENQVNIYKNGIDKLVAFYSK